jgi:hypothetical protein
LIQKNRENGFLLSLFLALKKKKFMGLVTAKEGKSNKCRQIRSSRYFLRLDADEGAKNLYLK